MRSFKAEFDFFSGAIVVSRDGLQPIAAYLTLDGRRALLAGPGGPFTFRFGMFGSAATDFGFHLGDLHRELTVE